MDIKKTCKMSKSFKKCPQCLKLLEGFKVELVDGNNKTTGLESESASERDEKSSTEESEIVSQQIVEPDDDEGDGDRPLVDQSKTIKDSTTCNPVSKPPEHTNERKSPQQHQVLHQHHSHHHKHHHHAHPHHHHHHAPHRHKPTCPHYKPPKSPFQEPARTDSENSVVVKDGQKTENPSETELEMSSNKPLSLATLDSEPKLLSESSGEPSKPNESLRARPTGLTKGITVHKADVSGRMQLDRLRMLSQPEASEPPATFAVGATLGELIARPASSICSSTLLESHISRKSSLDLSGAQQATSLVGGEKKPEASRALLAKTRAQRTVLSKDQRVEYDDDGGGDGDDDDGDDDDGLDDVNSSSITHLVDHLGSLLLHKSGGTSESGSSRGEEQHGVDKQTCDTKKMVNKVTQSYLNFAKQWAEYDPYITQPIPSNPWLSDSTELWDSERQTKEVHGRRIRRWTFSLKELLNDPAGREQFYRFLEKEFSAENLK